ncbi:hypothetical protein [Thermococcus alcaliphilus]|nr:hypothetical protein [Thermococcus alcaliphilus]MCO6041072.1 hypothetical protein [Thermococcus alcaliphilus]
MGPIDAGRNEIGLVVGLIVIAAVMVVGYLIARGSFREEEIEECDEE